MIDALFGSKTRVKLLHLFYNHPGQSFYVREITRLIGEQINSVRRELANMVEIGIAVRDSADNKLYYQVNQRYEHYLSLKSIFGDPENIIKNELPSENDKFNGYGRLLKDISGIRQAIFAGVLVSGSKCPVDVLIVGDVSDVKIKNFVQQVEKSEGRDINYTVMPYDEFYYRLSVRDRFINEVLSSKHDIIVDEDHILEKTS